jgi:5-methylcytosine-specific restriction endonuclease McrA
MTSSGRCHRCTQDDKYSAAKLDPEKQKAYMASWHEKNKDYELIYRKENAEMIRQNSAKWAKENPEKHSDNARLWRVKNIDRADENRRKWRRENPERMTLLSKRWRENNPEKQRTIMFNRNSASRGVRLAVKHGLLEKMMNFQSSKCAYCQVNISDEFHVDHLIPVSKGGGNSPENLQLLCPSCNLRKSAMMPEDFIKREAAQ